MMIDEMRKITESKNNLSLNELKIFYQCATMIDSVNHNRFKEYTIDAKHFCEKIGIDYENKRNFRNTLKKLVRQVFEMDDAANTGNYWGYPIFSKLEYYQKEQKVVFAFNDYMLYYLIKLKKNFTKIQNVKHIMSFESKYSIRIYSLLKDYRKMSERTFKLEILAEMFELPKSYKNFDFVKKKVLLPAIKEINEKSDLWVSEPEITQKIGKKIVEIRLKFGYKEPESEKYLDFTDQELIEKLQKLEVLEKELNKNKLKNIGNLGKTWNEISRVKTELQRRNVN